MLEQFHLIFLICAWTFLGKQTIRKVNQIYIYILVDCKSKEFYFNDIMIKLYLNDSKGFFNEYVIFLVF